jgi:hypothetical protein
MNRLILIALFLLGLCAGSAFGQYPAGCSKEATPSGFTGCELAQLEIDDAKIKDADAAKNAAALDRARLIREYFLEAMAIQHPGTKFEGSGADKKAFEAQWPHGRLVAKGAH